MTAPIACMIGVTSPVETALATLTGSLTIYQIAAAAMVAAMRPITATRLTLHRANAIRGV